MKNSGARPNRFIRWLLIIIGLLSTSMGLVGIVLPLVPTTPFLLLAAACFIRSSEKFYSWLINSPVLGRYILAYKEKRGLPLRAKVFILLFLWVTISFSAFVMVSLWFVRVFLFVIASAVTYHILSIRTKV